MEEPIELESGEELSTGHKSEDFDRWLDDLDKEDLSREARTAWKMTRTTERTKSRRRVLLSGGEQRRRSQEDRHGHRKDMFHTGAGRPDLLKATDPMKKETRFP